MTLCFFMCTFRLASSALLETGLFSQTCEGKVLVDTRSHYGRGHVTQRTVDRSTLIAEAPLATRFPFVPPPHTVHALTQTPTHSPQL